MTESLFSTGFRKPSGRERGAELLDPRGPERAHIRLRTWGGDGGMGEEDGAQ